MCGIVAYLGSQQAAAIILKGLQRLEYRGYDSAGLAVGSGSAGNPLQVRKKVGKVQVLQDLLDQHPVDGNCGIGHTRWATHGEPNDVNSHPHTSAHGKLAIVHNGIIENEAALRVQLANKGYTFTSETDTEVLAHLIDDVMRSSKCSLADAVPRALLAVTGTYGVVCIHSDEPDVLVGAKMGSPLLVAFGNNEFFMGSDATPFVEYTNKVVYLKDGEYAVVHRNGQCAVSTLSGNGVAPEIVKLEMDLQSIEKGGYEYFMLKEIMEQEQSINNCLRGRVQVDDNTAHVRLGGLEGSWQDVPILSRLRQAPRIVVVACGTSFHAGMVGKFFIEELAHVPVEVEYASEFRYRSPVLEPGCVVLAVSQSGETADTLAAVKMAKDLNTLALGMVNVVGSTIGRETHAGVFLHAGPEIGVASTKAFTAQVTVFAMVALLMAQNHTLSPDELRPFLVKLKQLPHVIGSLLPSLNQQVQTIAQSFRYAQNFLFLGRGVQFPVALEGALKLKEISYIHAEGYPASEVKHSLIALVQDSLPAMVIALRDESFKKTVTNIRELVSRGGVVVAVTDAGHSALDSLCEFVVRVPEIPQPPTRADLFLQPLLAVLPQQLLAYHVARFRGCNVDKPRNLAKSVTVE